jgi:hypothetical protein
VPRLGTIILMNMMMILKMTTMKWNKKIIILPQKIIIRITK